MEGLYAIIEMIEITNKYFLNIFYFDIIFIDIDIIISICSTYTSFILIKLME